MTLVGLIADTHIPDRVETLHRDIVFGHTHMPVIRWVHDKLIINPGSASCPIEEHQA